MARRAEQKAAARKRRHAEAVKQAKQRRRRIALGATSAVFVISAIAALSLLGGSSDEPVLAADFELPQIGGETVNLSEYRGQPVAVTFMHSW